MNCKIVNCVVVAELGYEINLIKVAKATHGNYDPNVFVAAKLPINGDRNVNLFPGGKAIFHVTGDSAEELIKKIDVVSKKINEVCEPYKIGNINVKPI